MVGSGIFVLDETIRPQASVIPDGVTWIKDEVTTFDPDNNTVNIKDGSSVTYHHMVVAPGLKINLDAVEGLKETLGKNGVTSNYLKETAPYTWKCVQNFTGGKAIFTQPPYASAHEIQQCIWCRGHYRYIKRKNSRCRS